MKKGTVISTVIGFVGGVVLGGAMTAKQGTERERKVDKFKTYYVMLNQWLALKEEGKNLEEYFLKNNYRNIALYGMGEMGRHLCEELKGSQVNIQYAIDKEAEDIVADMQVFSLQDVKDTNVDAVIVSAVFAFDEIEDELKGVFKCPVISLEDVIYEV